MTKANGLRREVVLLAVVFVPLLILRIIKDAGPGPYGLDASLYVQIARHVANGDGPISTASLYHHGFIVPMRPLYQPLWMLVLGYSARWMGLIEAATLLPRLFYIVDLLLLFVLARFAASRFEGEWARYAPHALVALFGTNLMFFISTTHPYREGLAYFFGLAALLAVVWIDRKRSMVSVVAAGALTALAYLARLEFTAVGVGCILAMLVCRIPWRLIVGYALAGLVTIAPSLFHHGYIPGLPWLTQWVDRPSIVIPRDPAPALSFADKLRDLIEAAMVAFQLGNRSSFAEIWGIAALLVPMAIVVAAVAWLRKRERAMPRDLLLLSIAFTGVILVIELLFFRGDVSAPFLHFMFGWRHGLMLIFLMIVVAPYLLARGPVLRVLTAMAIVISVVAGSRAVVRFVRAPNLTYSPAERAFLRWLPPKTTILTTRAQTLSMLSDGYFYGTYCSSPPASTRAYVEQLNVQYVTVYDGERRCRFLQNVGDLLTIHAAFGTGPNRIWLLERKPVTPR